MKGIRKIVLVERRLCCGIAQTAVEKEGQKYRMTQSKN